MILDFVANIEARFVFIILYQFGVIEAVKNSLGDSRDVTALWVTHRLEELEYADGAFYMEDGKIVMQADGVSILNFIKSRQSSYIERINS